MVADRRRYRFLAALFALCLAGCDDPEGAPPGDPGGGMDIGEGPILFAWIGADKDAFVACSTSIQCADGDQNFGGHSGLQVASVATLKHTYVHLHLPELPPGTTVLEAYFELYHPHVMEDGTPNEVCMDVAAVQGPWDPYAITWNDQPNVGPNSRDFRLALRPQAWSGSNDIAQIVQPLVDDPSAHHGWVVRPADNIAQYDKEFTANNVFVPGGGAPPGLDARRGPRLLLALELPEEGGEITLPDLPADNDLPFDGQEVEMARWRRGDDWPEDWAVTVKAPQPAHFCQD